MTKEELISAYVDGRMSEPERAAFEARLQADAALRRQVALTRLLVDQSRQVEVVPPPKNFILPHDFGTTKQKPAQRFDWRLLFFRLGSVAAAMVFVFAVAFDALRNTPPATTPAAAPMAAPVTSPVEAAITTNIEPVTATMAPTQASAGAAAMQAEATPMIQARAMQSGELSTMDVMVTIVPPSITTTMSQPLPSVASAKAMPAQQTQNVGTQSESLITPIRIIAGVALLVAVVLGVLGWRKT